MTTDPDEHQRRDPTPMKMHAGQVVTDVNLVRSLLLGQFPHWAELSVTPVPTFGTDHDIYRLGNGLAVRLPRIPGATAQVRLESDWLPRLARHLPLAIPETVAEGHPADGYPYSWAVHRWIPGEDGSVAMAELDAAAVELAGFMRALRGIDTSGAPPRRPMARGAPLSDMDERVRRSVAELGDRIDRRRSIRSWRESLEAPSWGADPVWVHGDLLPGNLLFVDGRLAAVIDFGCLGVGDPACDLLPAWNLFTGDSRTRFRDELDVDEASWLRGRGWALCQAVVALPYYWDTNPGMVRQALFALEEVLGDGRA